MKDKIESPDKDPLGQMLLDYLNGDQDAAVTVESTTLDMWEMTGRTMFRTFKQMIPIEKKALGLCKGRVLDIGAGSGCHSLYLQSQDIRVDSLDYSAGCVEVMKKRGVKHPFHDSLFALDGPKYDTLLMLMNGIGIAGSLDGLNLFFQFIKTILSKNGQLIADSTDLAGLYDPAVLLQSVLDLGLKDSYYGETQFTMTYQHIQSDPFDWVYLDFDTLARHAEYHGFSCENILSEKDGKFLCRIAFA